MASGTWLKCCQCSHPMWLPDALQTAAKAEANIMFYCAYGHQQHYPKGESEADRLRRERNRLAQQIAQRDDEIRSERYQREAAERTSAALRGQMTKLKKRTISGVCPCCTRSFVNLRRHIATKHPDFTADDPKVVPLRGVGNA